MGRIFGIKSIKYANLLNLINCKENIQPFQQKCIVVKRRRQLMSQSRVLIIIKKYRDRKRREIKNQAINRHETVGL